MGAHLYQNLAVGAVCTDLQGVYFFCLELLTLIVKVFWCDGAVARETVSVGEGLSESVRGSTFSSACDIRDRLSRNFDENGAIGEEGDYFRP